jgi:hypothetical protein
VEIKIDLNVQIENSFAELKMQRIMRENIEIGIGIVTEKIHSQVIKRDIKMQIDYTTEIDSNTVRGRAGFHKYKIKIKNKVAEVSKQFTELLEKYHLVFNVSIVWIDITNTNFWKIDKKNTCIRKKGKEIKVSFMIDASQSHVVDLEVWGHKYIETFSRAFWYAANIYKITDLEILKKILFELDSNFDPIVYTDSPNTDSSIDIELTFNNNEDWATDLDLDIRDKIRDRICSQLIKLGIGEWVGDSFGKETNEVGFKVTNEDKAKTIILNVLKEFQIRQFTIEIE